MEFMVTSLHQNNLRMHSGTFSVHSGRSSGGNTHLRDIGPSSLYPSLQLYVTVLPSRVSGIKTLPPLLGVPGSPQSTSIQC